MNAATDKVDAAKIPNGPVNLLADAPSFKLDSCLLVPCVVLELSAALQTGRHCKVLAGVRAARGTAAAVMQRSLHKLCAACILTKVSYQCAALVALN